jgi:hypothetical protein
MLKNWLKTRNYLNIQFYSPVNAPYLNVLRYRNKKQEMAGV